MKILAIGDPHFRLDLPYADYVADRRRGEREALYEFLHEKAKEADAVVLMGDNLDKRHNHSSVIKEFVEFLDGFGDKQLFIISGNHETYEGDKTAIDFLKGRKPNWNVMTPKDGIVAIDFKGDELGFIPYMTRGALEVNNDSDGSKRITKEIAEHVSYTGKQFSVIFAHHAISGTSATGAMADLFNEIVLDRGSLERYSKLLVGGHIHQPSTVGRTIVTGSLMTQDMGEIEKKAWMVDTDGTYEPVKLPVRPIYKFEHSQGGTEVALSGLDKMSKKSIVKFINHDKTTDLDEVRGRLAEFDGSILVEDYPSERKRLDVNKNQTLDLSITSLLNLYAQARGKDPKRLQEAFSIIEEA